MYCLFFQNIWKYLFLVQYIWKVLNFMENIRKTSCLYPKQLKSICSWPETFKLYRISKQKIWNNSDFCAKHLKGFVFVFKTFEIYLVSFQNIWKVSSVTQKNWKVFHLSPKYSKSKCISNCVILVQKTGEILNFYAKHSIKVVFCKRKFWELLIPKILEKYIISHLYTKHLKSL